MSSEIYGEEKKNGGSLTFRMSYVYVDPVTRQRILHASHIGDLQYDRSGDDTIAQEDVPVIGAWEDWTGSGGVSTKTQMLFAGQENTLQGDDPQLTDNAKVPNLTSRGNVAGMNRQRTRKEHVDL